MNDIVHKTSLALVVTPKQLFKQASEEMHFTNADEVAKNRYERWVKFGEIPPYVESHCKRQLERATNMVRIHEYKEPEREINGGMYPLFI